MFTRAEAEAEATPRHPTPPRAALRRAARAVPRHLTPPYPTPRHVPPREECGGRAGGQCSFAVVLSIFFPAVTDPLAGSNLSGDLRTPQQSIPIGTILAVLVTTLVFCLQVLFVGGSVERETLLTDRTVVAILSWPVKELVFMGMCLSTMGAGLQSLAGAPRLLAAIGKDRLLPR